MTPNRLISYEQRLQEHLTYWEERCAGHALVPHELDLPATLAQLRRDLDAGYRLTHQGWNGE